MDVALPDVRAAEHVQALRTRVEARLARLIPENDPPELYEPVRYVLAGGGKRLRPLLLLLSAEAFGVDPEEALPAALSVEVFHNFTLVHDDIMDRAEERRGRPTVHVRWDQSTAILAGDYMMGLAYDLLAQVEVPRLGTMIRTYHRMVRLLCEGQMLDTVFERREHVSVADYLRMIDGKTAALLSTSMELGGLIGGAGEGHRTALRDAGQHVGRAFQIQDDLLDLTADDTRWGKTIGGDLTEGKKTYLLLRALERASGDEADWFRRIVTARGLPAADIAEARSRMEALGVLDEAAHAVERHSQAAFDALDRLPAGPAVDTLRWLIRRMQARAH